MVQIIDNKFPLNRWSGRIRVELVLHACEIDGFVWRKTQLAAGCWQRCTTVQWWAVVV
jgi:hypothetical protein